MIRKSQELQEGEFFEKQTLFNTILPKLEGYIQRQSRMRASKLPDEGLGVEDFESVGRIQVWAAVVSWDPAKGPLMKWAKRCIWTNMNVVISGQFQSKRVPRETSTGEFQRTVSLSLLSEGFDSLLDESVVDPLDDLLEEELYFLVREKLLSCDERIAAAVLRLALFPDDELLSLCNLCEGKGSKKSFKISNRLLAARLGVSASRVAEAKHVLRETILDQSTLT